MTKSFRRLIICVVAILSVTSLHLSAQRLHYAQRPDVENGAKVYKGGCIACHGSDGKGAPMASTVFLRPDTFPDFMDCAGTTPEPDGNWKAAIVHGGPSRGLSQIMPAFGDLLTDDQINDVIAYMRGFCRNVHHYPLGELNLPRALVTEKAFPENEIVVSTAASASGAPAWTTDVIDERTIIDARTQLETDVPVTYADQNHNWTAGFGDITLGVKRELFSSLRTGSILSVQGGILLPTGDSKRGFGAGTTQFEPFAAFDQLFDAILTGGRVALLGLPAKPALVDWNKIIFKQLTIKGIYGREMFETWHKMIAMLESGLDVRKVITHRLPVDKFLEGFEIMRRGESGKIVLDWDADRA